MSLRRVAVLYCRPDSIYKNMPGVDAWDAERDARKWAGGCSVVAHPPCRGWGRMRRFATKVRPGEKQLAIDAVWHVRKWGGVLEHPAHSSLWVHMGLPEPGEPTDAWGGYSIQVRQFDYGHRAEKKTWLYICGIEREKVKLLPWRNERPTHCIRPTKSYPRLPSVPKKEREATPPIFAKWLVQLARSTSTSSSGGSRP